MRNTSWVCGFVVLCASITAAQAATPAQGQVALEKQNWSVADAIAYRHGDEVLVVLSDKAYDRAAFAKDGKLDDFDFIHHTMDTGASTLTLKFDAEFKLNVMEYSLHGGSGARSGNLGDGWALGKHSATAIAGTFKYADGADKVAVSFDLPIQSDKLERAGKPLAADGGDPGKAAGQARRHRGGKGLRRCRENAWFHEDDDADPGEGARWHAGWRQGSGRFSGHPGRQDPEGQCGNETPLRHLVCRWGQSRCAIGLEPSSGQRHRARSNRA
jgi:hypothetical protein